MSLTIPDIQNITNGVNGLDFQASEDSTDKAALQAALSSSAYVISGCQVTQDTGSDMKIAIASGAVMINNTIVQYAGTGASPISITAAGASDRRDIVTISSTGTITVTAGALCGTAGWTRSSSGNPLPPVKPSIPANSCLLAEVGVPNGTTAITTAVNIVDKTTIVYPIASGVGTPNTAAQSLTASSANLLTGTLIPLGTGQIQVGSRWRIAVGVSKTAAGTATWSLIVKFGTAGTTSDAAIATWTSGTNTAAADYAVIWIEVVITAIGTSATAACLAFYSNTLTGATGLGSIGAAPGSTATFNANATNPFIHVDVTPGSSAVMTGWGTAQRLT